MVAVLPRAPALHRIPLALHRIPLALHGMHRPHPACRAPGSRGAGSGWGRPCPGCTRPNPSGETGAVGYRPCGGSWRTAASVVGPSLPGRWTEQPRGRLPRPPRRQVPRQSLQQHPALRTAAPSAPGGCSTPEVRRGDGPAAPVAYDGHASLGLELVVVSVALDEAEQSLQHHASSVTLEAALRPGPLARSWSAVRAFPRPPHVSVHQHRIAYTAHPRARDPDHEGRAADRLGPPLVAARALPLGEREAGRVLAGSRRGEAGILFQPLAKSARMEVLTSSPDRAPQSTDARSQRNGWRPYRL